MTGEYLPLLFRICHAGGPKICGLRKIQAPLTHYLKRPTAELYNVNDNSLNPLCLKINDVGNFNSLELRKVDTGTQVAPRLARIQINGNAGGPKAN